MATKDITDEQVCRAVQNRNDALKALSLLHSPLGIFGHFGLKPLAYTPPFPHEALAVSTGQPEKVCYRAMERAERRGLIEYGVSLRTGWLTAKGKALLES